MIDVETGIILNNAYVMLGYSLPNGLVGLDDLHTRSLLYMYFIFRDNIYLQRILHKIKDDIMVGDLSLEKPPRYISDIIIEDVEIKRTGKCTETQFKKYCLKANIIGANIYIIEQILDYFKELCRLNESMFKERLGNDVRNFLNFNDSSTKLSNIDGLKNLVPNIVIKKELYDKNGLDAIKLFKDYVSLNMGLY